MLVALLFIIASLALGYSLSSLLKFRKGLSEEIAISAALGFACTTLIVFLLSLAESSLNEPTVFIVSAAAIMLHLWDKQERGLSYPKPDWEISPSFAVAFALFAVVAYFLCMAFVVDSQGAIYSIPNAWGDYPLHFGIINSFAAGDNFPPQYPNLAGAIMRYPFLFDFLSAILVVGGLSLQMAVLIPGILMAFSMVFLARMLALELGKTELAASACLLFFFLNGTLASLAFVGDFGAAPDTLAFLSTPADYATPGGQQAGLANFVSTIFVPQRTVLMGFALALLAYFLLYRIYSRQAHEAEYLLAGLCVALLPFEHVASFAVAGLAFGLVFLNELRHTKLKAIAGNGKILLMLAPVVLLAVPQLLWMNEQPRAPGFFGVQPGWLAKTTDLGQIAQFWLNNAGIVLPLAVIGLLAVNPKRRLAYAPFLLVFAAANLFRFQPWDWDNTKYFLHWMFFTALFAGIGLNWLWQKISAKSRPAASIAASLLLLSGVLSGAVVLWYWPMGSAQLFSTADVKAAELVRQDTPPGAVVVTAMRHNELVYALAGRQIVMGYEGHTWSHGLSSAKNKEIVQTVFRTGNACAAEGVAEYVFVGPQEQSDFVGAREMLLRFNAVAPVFDETIGGAEYSLFKAAC